MKFWRATVDSFQLLRCLLAGGPGLAAPFDVEDPPPAVLIQPTVGTWTLPSAPPEVLHRAETLSEALDRFSFVNRVARAELDDRVFKLRELHWMVHGHTKEPFLTDARAIDALRLGFACKATEQEEHD